MISGLAVIAIILVTTAVGVLIINAGKKHKKTLIVLLIGANLLLGGWVFGTTLPVSVQYQREYKSHINMAYTQATFEGVRYEVITVWKSMNETFKGYDYKSTYSSPFYWDQNYENSLEAQNNYFKSLINRIDSYIEQYQKLKISDTTSMLQDWYDQSMQNLRTEMKYEGGLDWVLADAWLLNFHPTVYWVDLIVWLIYALCVIIWWAIILNE